MRAAAGSANEASRPDRGRATRRPPIAAAATRAPAATGADSSASIAGGRGGAKSSSTVQARRLARRSATVTLGWTRPDSMAPTAWRLTRAREDGVPPYVVFHDSVLHAIVDAQPKSLGDLSQIAGVGPSKLERYGDAVLALLAAA